MTSNNIAHIKNLVVLAHVDGVIDTEEIELLHELAEEIGITAEELDHWLENASELILNIPEAVEERERHLVNMISLANSDGHFSQSEYELCKLMADKLPYSGLGQALAMRMNKSYLKNLVALATSDGNVDDTEMNLLSEAAEKAGVSKHELQIMIDGADEYKYYIPESYEDRETQLIQMLTLAIADGDFSEDEYSLCKMVAEKLDFTEKELQLIIRLSFKGNVSFNGSSLA